MIDDNENNINNHSELMIIHMILMKQVKYVKHSCWHKVTLTEQSYDIP